MEKYPFRKIEELWERHGCENPMDAYKKVFKNEVEFDIDELQKRYEKEKKKIDREMNFVNMDPDNMSEEYKRIFDKNLAIVQCGEDLNSLFKVLSLD
jgi:hypothetical protein